MMPLDFEGVAAERARLWEIEIKQQWLISQIPRTPPFWRRWLGNGMVRGGNWLTSWGEWMAQCECGEGMTVANNSC
jgi:hypothetical protein